MKSSQKDDGPCDILSNAGSTFAYIIDNLVSLSCTDKVDPLGMKSVTLSLRHLEGFLIFHLQRFESAEISDIMNTSLM